MNPALTVGIFSPSISVGSSFSPEGRWIEDIIPTSWRHTIRAVGGWWDASFQLYTTRSRIDSWLEDGVGRHIKLYSPSGSLLFSGFVNEVTANIGPSQIKVGPLMEANNRVSVMYTPILDPDTLPPLTGTTLSTTIAEDADIQAKYGIIETILSSGTLLTDDAEQIRDTYLAENKEPRASQSVSNRPQSPHVTCNVLGYVHYLKKYIYNNTTSPTSTTIDAKMEAVLGADPNGLFSTDYSQIETNGLLVPSYENDNRTAWAILESMTARGDINENRYIFGVYGDERAEYGAIPTTVTYTQSHSDKAVRIFDESFSIGKQVFPWEVLPGRWLREEGLRVGADDPSDLRADPTIMFIEQVTYEAPYGVTMVGGKTDKLGQKLAQLGLGSISG